MQMRAGLARLMEEFADAGWAFQREGGVQRTPGERDGAGAAVISLFAASDMAGAGKLSLQCAAICPVFGVCGQTNARCRLEKKLRYVFKCDHCSVAPRRAASLISPRQIQASLDVDGNFRLLRRCPYHITMPESVNTTVSNHGMPLRAITRFIRLIMATCWPRSFSVALSAMSSGL